MLPCSSAMRNARSDPMVEDGDGDMFMTEAKARTIGWSVQELHGLAQRFDLTYLNYQPSLFPAPLPHYSNTKHNFVCYTKVWTLPLSNTLTRYNRSNNNICTVCHEVEDGFHLFFFFFFFCIVSNMTFQVKYSTSCNSVTHQSPDCLS